MTFVNKNSQIIRVRSPAGTERVELGENDSLFMLKEKVTSISFITLTFFVKNFVPIGGIQLILILLYKIFFEMR